MVTSPLARGHHVRSWPRAKRACTLAGWAPTAQRRAAVRCRWYAWWRVAAAMCGLWTLLPRKRPLSVDPLAPDENTHPIAWLAPLRLGIFSPVLRDHQLECLLGPRLSEDGSVASARA